MASELRTIYPGAGQKPSAPLTPGISVDNLVFVSGQVPRNPGGDVVGTTIGDQTREVIENLKRVLDAAGTSLDRVVRTTVYLTSIADMAGMNEVYRDAFGEALPTRTTIEVSALGNPAYLVEIDAIAVR